MGGDRTGTTIEANLGGCLVTGLEGARCPSAPLSLPSYWGMSQREGGGMNVSLKAVHCLIQVRRGSVQLLNLCLARYLISFA